MIGKVLALLVASAVAQSPAGKAEMVGMKSHTYVVNMMLRRYSTRRVGLARTRAEDGTALAFGRRS